MEVNIRTFVFRFRRFDTVGINDDGPEIATVITIKAKSWRYALRQLRKELRGYQERFFRQLMVAESGRYYEPVIITGSFVGGNLFIGDLHRAHFHRPTAIAP